MSFAKSLNFVLKWEGAYVNDPHDPGGETKYGISKKAYPNLDIKNLTKDDAAKIYKADYWDEVYCDTREPKLAASIFDAAVNVGVPRVKKWLKDDFKINVLNHEEFNARREYFYRAEVKLSLRNRYLNGWINRLNDLRRFVATL